MVKDVADLKLLVTEGNRHMRDLMVKLLHSMDIKHVCLAFDQTTGLQNLRFNRFDAVITDHHGETVDGFEFARQIRASTKESTRTVPIVMLVQNRDPELAAEAREAGATLIVVKPFTADEFYNAIYAIRGEEKGPSRAEASAWIGGR